MPKEIIRKKRLVLDSADKLRGLWFSKREQLLRLTYDYSPSVFKEPIYKEYIEIAIENFNSLGLAHLEHRRIAMGNHFKICPLDEEYIKAKYKNPIIFSVEQFPKPDNTVVCHIKNNRLFYDPTFSQFLMSETGGNNVTLPPFAKIICNPAHKLFQRMGIGIILHEINHLFGFKHTHTLEETNGIININIAKPELNDIPKGQVGTIFNIYSYTPFLQVSNYTLVSPFSIQHYRERALMPFLAFNKTRIDEILDSVGFSPKRKSEYKYLLSEYAGYPISYTYQDIAGLATAIYHIAPDSLLKNNFDFPNYFFVAGIYLPRTDKLKLASLFDTLMQVERFEYPILAQKNVKLVIEKSSIFSKNIYKSLKIITFPQALRCKLLDENAIFSRNLTLSSDCWLSGKLESSIFQLPILLSRKSTSKVCYLQLVAESKSKHLKNRVLLGRNKATCFMKKTAYVAIASVCQAVALPADKKLSCHLENVDLAQNVALENCWYYFQEEKGNQNVTFIVSNAEANKTCYIQFLLNETSVLEEVYPLVNLSDANFQFVENEGYYAVNSLSHISVYQKKLLLRQLAQRTVQAEMVSRFVQFNYCVSLPFVQGVLESLIDSAPLHVYSKSVLKWLPRVGLYYFNCLNLINVGVLCASFLEGVLKNYLKGKINNSIEKTIAILLFLCIAELEYGFSNLWLLSGQLAFWPMLLDGLNQLFLQTAFAPSIKALGYGIGLMLSQYLFASSVGKEPDRAPLTSDTEHVLLRKSSQPIKLSFFTALHTASQTVFSMKTLKRFSLFTREVGRFKQEYAPCQKESEVLGVDLKFC